MLATLVAQAFDKTGWIFEEKYDGDRILAYKEEDRVKLLSRNGKDRTSRFPGVTAAIGSIQAQTLVLDGEVVVFDNKGISRFQLLQQRKGNPVYAVFDCLFRDGKDLRQEPLSVRRAEMEHLIDRTKSLLRSRILATNGLDAFRIARRRGYEGVVAKDLSSSYMEARSTKWLKVKIRQEEEYVICGYTRPAGSRSHFGALLLGAYSGKALHYVGKVGTGFDEATLAKLHQELLPLVRSESALVDPPREKGIIFVKPKYIAQISFQEWTTDKKLRQPVYLGLRDDKDFRDVRLPDPSK